MAQETLYFPHDYSPMDDPKVQALVGSYGADGYGIFWRVVEMLHTNETHVLPLKSYLFTAVSKQMLTPVDRVTEIIYACIQEFELFTSNEDYFWSERVFKNIRVRLELSEKRSKAGKASALARKKLQEFAETHPEIDTSTLTGVQQVLTDVEQVSSRVNKEKNSKV